MKTLPPIVLWKKQQTERFFAEAFCIDGIAEIIPVTNGKGFKIGAIVKMTDSKRGTFYVAKVEPTS